MKLICSKKEFLERWNVRADSYFEYSRTALKPSDRKLYKARYAVLMDCISELEMWHQTKESKK